MPVWEDPIIVRARQAMADFNRAKQQQEITTKKAIEDAMTLVIFGDIHYEEGDKKKAFENYKDVLSLFWKNSKYKQKYMDKYFDILLGYFKIIEQEGKNPIEEFDSDIITRYEEAEKMLKKMLKENGDKSVYYQKYQEAFSWVLSNLKK